MLTFSKYLLSYQHNPVSLQKHVCLYSVTKIIKIHKQNTIVHGCKQFLNYLGLYIFKTLT